MWYAVIADLKGLKYDIVCSNVMKDDIEYEANIVIQNFNLAFKESCGLAYRLKHFGSMHVTPIQWISDNDNQLSA